MNSTIEQLAVQIGNPDEDLRVRIEATRAVRGAAGGADAAKVRALLNRKRPIAEFEIKNWDVAGAERIVDLHIIEALHELRDDSELGRIGPLVRQAGRILQGHYEEVRHAAEVIRNIQRKDPLKQLIKLTEVPDEEVVRNAVRTLNLLDLPHKPIGGEVDSIEHLSAPVTFEAVRLKPEIEQIAALSEGSIILSDGTKTFIRTQDFDRGQVRREQVKLADVVEEDLERLDLCYYVTNDRVVICTYTEAGERWRTWWWKYHSSLDYK